MTSRASHPRSPILNDDPDLPACLAPHRLAPGEVEQLLEVQKVASRLVRVGVLPRSAALQLVRYANRAADRFVVPRIKLASVLGALVRAARDGTLVEREHWASLDEGVLAFHVPSALDVLRRHGRTHLRLGEFARLVQAGAVYRASCIVDTRRRVTFRPNDRRRALVLNEAAITGRGPVVPEPDDYALPTFGRRVPDDAPSMPLAPAPDTEGTEP
jgi:hypothetical protein